MTALAIRTTGPAAVPAAPKMPKIDAKTFFDKIKRPLFGGSFDQTAVDNINVLLTTWARYPKMPRDEFAYVLATVLAEVGRRMGSVRETFANTDAEAIRNLESAWRRGDLPWVKTPYWREGWFGRGLAQITHKDNYRRLTVHLQARGYNVDLVANRDLALEQKWAALILFEGMIFGLFTGRRLSHYIDPARGVRDYKGARRIINGQNRAAEIARYAMKFRDALLAAEAAYEPDPEPDPKPDPRPDPDPGDNLIRPPQAAWQRLTPQAKALIHLIFKLDEHGVFGPAALDLQPQPQRRLPMTDTMMTTPEPRPPAKHATQSCTWLGAVTTLIGFLLPELREALDILQQPDNAAAIMRVVELIMMLFGGSTLAYGVRKAMANPRPVHFFGAPRPAQPPVYLPHPPEGYGYAPASPERYTGV